jgi:hypothetical protein
MVTPDACLEKRHVITRRSNAACQLFGGAVCAEAVLLMASRAHAQNLFVAEDFGGGDIYEFTLGGVQSTYATGLGYPDGMAFNSAGDLFVANSGTGTSTNSRWGERKALLPVG